MVCKQEKRKSGAVPEYKVGVEVKALFKKNHIDLLHPEAEALEEKRVLFINEMFKKVISGESSEKDREDIGSFISAVEYGSALMRTTTETVYMSSTTS